MKLGLGTAQFGLSYGISNQRGQLSIDEAERVLTLAIESGIRTLDTAASYGTSEHVIGELLPKLPPNQFDIVTKISFPNLRDGQKLEACLVEDQLMLSMERLRVSKLFGVLFHHADDILNTAGEVLLEALYAMRSRGLVGKIGFSAYEGHQVDRALERFNFDLIQVPLNVLDQRLIEGGQLTRLKMRGIEVHIRSVFLQGLLLMNPLEVPRFFSPIQPSLVAWRKALEERGLTPAQGAFAFIRSLNVADVVVVGVESVSQLESNVRDFRVDVIPSLDYDSFAIRDDRYLNPSKWILA